MENNNTLSKSNNRRISGLLQVWISGIVIAQSEILILTELINLSMFSGVFLLGFFSLCFGGGLVGILGMIDIIRWCKDLPNLNGKKSSKIKILGLLSLGIGFVGLEGYVSAVIWGIPMVFPILMIFTPLLSIVSAGFVSFGTLRSIQGFLISL